MLQCTFLNKCIGQEIQLNVYKNVCFLEYKIKIFFYKIIGIKRPVFGQNEVDSTRGKNLTLAYT